MKLLLTALAMTLVYGMATATPAPDSAPRVERAVSFQPCSWWQYDFQSNNYVCRSPGGTVKIYTSAEVDALIGKLERRIEALEARIREE